MNLTKPSKGAPSAAPQQVELVYSVIPPDVIKPTAQVQATLIRDIKLEAMERLYQGKPLAFRLRVADLFDVAVTPGREGIPLPRWGENLELVVKRKADQNASASLVKEVSQFLLTEHTYPSEVWRERYERLIGLKEIKNRVLTGLKLLFSEDFARAWIAKHHPQATAEDLLEEAYPVFVFDGKPGLGKSELARAIGDPLSRALGSTVVSYSIGLQLRGGGLVGELSQNIAKIIEFGKLRHEERGVPILLLVDEADAIGHSRGGGVQHHEDMAGVSTLLQQIDLLQGIPGVALIFTTNRHDALDEALQKRTNAQWVTFPLPGYAGRLHLVTRLLGTLLPSDDLSSLAWETEGLAPRDIVQLVRRAAIEAISLDMPLTRWHLFRAAAILMKHHPSQRNSHRHGNIVRVTSNPQKRTECAVHANGHRGTRAF